MPRSSRPVVRYQRRILAWGAGLACLLYVVGAPFYLDRVERDLTGRVTEALVAAGFDGFTVSFSGQTGSIDCARPLGDPQAALEVAYDVRGVHAMADLPDACRVLTAPPIDETTPSTAATSVPTGSTTTSSTTTTTPDADFATVLSVLDGNPQFSLLHQLVQDAELTELGEPGDLTLFAPTDEAFDALSADAVAQLRSDPELLDRVLRHHVVDGRLLVDDLATGDLTTWAGDELAVDARGPAPLVGGAKLVGPAVLAGNGVVHAVDQLLLPDGVDLTAPEEQAAVTATYGDAGYLLQGTVRSEVERTILLDAATAALDADRVTDELTVDPDTGLAEARANELATLVAAVPSSLLDGTAGFDGTRLFVSGTYVDAAQRAAIEQVAAEVGAETDLVERPDATPEDAAELETALNDYVAEHPILFEPGASVLDDTAGPILDELARRARRLAGVVITVEGHTDSDGNPQENLILSQLRAIAVQEALVERGLDPDTVAAEGFGSTDPILVDGVEDKAASRRVEFRVEVA